VLRSDMADEAGKVIEQVMFIDVEMLADQAAVGFIGASADAIKEQTLEEDDAAQAKSNPVSDSQWQVRNMPAGFKLSERYLREDEGNGVSQEQLVFTDGLASVSVFIEPHRAQDEPMLGETSIGVVNVYGKLINNHQVMVVGDVPKTTVEVIAGSLIRH